MSFPNAPVELEMRNGSVKLSLTMRQLYVVWRRWPSIWKEFNRIVALDKRTLDDMARLIYVASCCAAVAEGQEPPYADIESFEADMTASLEVVTAAYTLLMSPKKSNAFREAFERRTRKTSGAIRVPKFKLVDPDDYYVFMVVINGISESLFWDADFAFLWDVAKNKGAYDAWLTYEQKRRS